MNKKLSLAIKEIEKIDLLFEEKRYTEEQLLDILLKYPKREKKFAEDKEYAKIIDGLKEGGLL